MMKPKSRWWSAILFAIGIAIYLLALLLANDAINFAHQSIRELIGWSPFVLNSIVLLLSIPFSWAIVELVRTSILLRLQDPENPENHPAENFRKKLVAWMTICIFVLGYIATIHFAGANSNFGHVTGKALKHYSITPEGVRFFDSPGFDPVYGIELKPTTPELIELMKRQESGNEPQQIHVRDLSQIRFFDPLDGSPRIWFSETPSGEIELFSAPGAHPTYGRKLLPITTKIVAELQANVEQELKDRAQEEKTRQESAAREQAEEKKQVLRRRSEHLFNLSEARTNTAVAIVNNGEIDFTLSTYIAEQLQGTSSFFKPTSVSDGIFDSLYDGRSELLRPLLTATPRRLIVGKFALKTEPSAIRTGMVRIQANLTLRVIDTTSDFSARTLTGTGTAARFSEMEARVDALQIAADQILTKID